MAQFLPDHLVDTLLLELHGWHRRGTTLERTYQTTGDAEALAFVNRVTEAVSGSGHEPALDARAAGHTVHLAIHSPAADGITDAAIELARELDRLGPPPLAPVGPGRLHGDPSQEAQGIIGRGRPMGAPRS